MPEGCDNSVIITNTGATCPLNQPCSQHLISHDNDRWTVVIKVLLRHTLRTGHRWGCFFGSYTVDHLKIGQMISTDFFLFCVRRRVLCWECLKKTLQPCPTTAHSSIRPCRGFTMHRYTLTDTIHRCIATGCAGMGMTCRNINMWEPSAVFLFKNELSAATHLTSRLLKEYDKQVGQVILTTYNMTQPSAL